MSVRNSDVYLSKSLSWLLRHGAEEAGLNIDSEGFVDIEEILNHKSIRNKFTLNDILRVVETNDKQRFAINKGPVLKIRANQGHTIKKVNCLELKPITTPPNFEIVHGTFFKNWANIQRTGLSRMQRNHIHFAKQFPNGEFSFSVRKNAEIYIYVDVSLALSEGYKFFESQNGVILCLESLQKGRNCSVMDRHNSRQGQTVNPGIFVKGFPENTDKNYILNYFSKFGPIANTDFRKHFLILDFANARSADMVLRKKYHMLGGHRLYIKPKIIIQKSPHIRQESLIDITEHLKQAQSFEEELLIFQETIQPSEIDHENIERAVIKDLRRALSSLSLNCEIHRFGSSQTGLFFGNSDIDVYVSGVKHFNAKDAQTLFKMKRSLERYEAFSKILVIPSAKIPIIKCTHAATNKNIDINVKNILGVKNSNLVRYFLTLDPKVKPSILILKYWSKKHELSGKSHLFSSYAVIMMFLFYLQENFGFPSIYQLQKNAPKDYHDDWNSSFIPLRNFRTNLVNFTILEVLKGFFDYYSVFDFSSKIVCPFLGHSVKLTDFSSLETVPKEYEDYKLNVSNRGIEPLKTKCPVCIQDPFEHSRNIAVGVTPGSLESFIENCNLASTIISRSESNVLFNLFSEKIVKPQIKNYLEFSIHMKEISPDKQSNIDGKIYMIAWFKTVVEFVRIVLTQFFCLETVRLSLDDVKKKLFGDVKGLIEPEGFHSTAKYNTWDNRKAIDKEIVLPPGSKLVVIESAIGDALVKRDNDSDPKEVFEFLIGIKLEEKPNRVDIKIMKMKSKKKVFSFFSLLLSKNIPSWFYRYEREIESE